MKILYFVLLVILLSQEIQSKDQHWNHLKSLFSIYMKGGGIFNPKRNEMTFVSNEKGVGQLYKQKFNPRTGKLTGKAKIIIKTKDRCTYPSYMDDGSLLFLHDRGLSFDF